MADDDRDDDFFNKVRTFMGRSMYFGRKGEPLTLMEYAERHNITEYVRVAYDDIPPTSRYAASYLSTVWLGLDHSFLSKGPPLIFETMRFLAEATEANPFFSGRKFHGSIEFPDPEDKPGEYIEQLRYSTEEQASLGHRAIVRLIQELEMT